MAWIYNRRRRRRRRKQILILYIYVGYVQLYGWRSTGCVNIDKPPGWLSSLRFLFFLLFFFFPPLSDVLFIIISSSVFFFLFFLPLFLMKSRVTWSRPNERMTSYRPTGHDEIEKKTTNSYFMLSLRNTCSYYTYHAVWVIVCKWGYETREIGFNGIFSLVLYLSYFLFKWLNWIIWEKEY